MAIEYAKVLNVQGVPFVCITRSESSASKLLVVTGATALTGGLEHFLLGNPSIPKHAIVATGIESLASVTESLLHYGVTSILVEKPAGVDVQQIEKTQKLAERNNANVFVAYNRRFYESVITAKKMIAEDGGATSLTYEITEWSHSIDKLDIDKGIKYLRKCPLIRLQPINGWMSRHKCTLSQSCLRLTTRTPSKKTNSSVRFQC